MWVILNSMNILYEFIIYLIIDNITKFMIVRHGAEYRFYILLYECMCLGFLIGFALYYYAYISYILSIFLCIHMIGTIYSKRSLDRLKEIILISIRLIRNISNYFHNLIKKQIIREKSSVTCEKNQIPHKLLYNYHLKPTNDLRLQQSSLIQTISRPGILNLYGTTCSLNALVQGLASSDCFYSTFQRNINLSRFNYDPIVTTFIDLIYQLRNDYSTCEHKQWIKIIDTSKFISNFNSIYPNLLTKTTKTDICELFQCIIDILNNSLSKQSILYSTNIIEQVQNRQLTTHSIEYLNKLYSENDEYLHDKITLDNLDAQTSYIVQYVDLTWLLHHLQLGSIVKHCFSGQILHAHCCQNCSHVRFRTEPFQLLILPIKKPNTTLEKLISQFTNIEFMDSISCSHCSSNEKFTGNSSTLSKITTPLSPIVTSRRPISDKIYSSTPISASTTTTTTTILPTRIQSRIKSQVMIANFPDILCIQLKRFSYDRLSNTTTKLNAPILIEYNKILNLTHLHYTTWLGLINSSKSYNYRLIAVCLHLSDTSSIHLRENPNGHYVCVYRSSHNKWFLTDDERITEINQIENFFQTSYVTENCYLIIYERCL